ncbi:hypothetical protein [Algibacter mikhailovii]|nr:hypothetical protein [Algibacter mikhailovii]
MRTKRNNAILNTIQVVSKNNIVFLKSNTEANSWRPINFKWIPVFKIEKP